MAQPSSISVSSSAVAEEVRRSALLRALRAVGPIAFGYVPVGFAFGVLLNQLGGSVLQSVASGVLIYAGSAQLLIAKLLPQTPSLIEIFVAVFMLNFRHVFYGLTMLSRYASYPFFTKLYLIHSLSDETYAVLSTEPHNLDTESRLYHFFVSFGAHFYWILGSVLGSVFANTFEINIKGLDFVMTALFVVLFVEQIFRVKRAAPFLLAGVAGAISLLVAGQHFLPLALAISTVAVLLIKTPQRKV
jgi:4-azaleucine resistance transporter AzlC